MDPVLLGLYGLLAIGFVMWIYSIGLQRRASKSTIPRAMQMQEDSLALVATHDGTGGS